MSRLGHEFFVAASLDDLAVLHDDDLIAVADGGQPVGYDHAGTAPAFDIVHDLFFHKGIQGAGGLVHDQNRRVGDQRAGDLQTLALPAGHIITALCQDILICPGLLRDDIMDAGVLCRLYHVLLQNALIPHGQIIPDRTGEQGNALQL